jgi:transcriptional regulator with XRE-family HTH domain
MQTTEDRLKKAFNYLKLEGLVSTQEELSEKLGYDKATVSQAFNGSKRHLTNSFISKFCKKFIQIDEDWITEGRGKMLKSETEQSKNIIPFYDDAVSIGGVNDRVAEMDAVSSPTEYIDTGDWFKDATAAIRHYGDSMTEYPSGCILALREVKERQLVIWGKDYVIETNEYRITKCVQRGTDSEHITAYSSSIETYPDGRLKHEPKDFAWDDVRRIFLVLGYVVKKNGGTIVFSNQNK